MVFFKVALPTTIRADSRMVGMVEKERRLAKVIGSAIANQRKLAGLTQDDVAERLDIGKQAIPASRGVR